MIYAKTVDEYLEKSDKWKEGLSFLRALLNQTTLSETVKWGGPVYTLKGKNVIGIGCFKSFISIWFYQGVFLSDPESKLINAQEEKTRGLRQLRYDSLESIIKDKALILSYIEEAIQNQKDGKEIKIIRNRKVELPEELVELLNSNPSLNDSFKALSPGKQREYAEYIATAKQELTRINRLKKITPLIEQGIGLNDKYK